MSKELLNFDSCARKASVDDASALHALRLALFEQTDMLLWEPGEYRATVADEAVHLEQIQSQPNSLCLVVEKDGELVGLLNAMGGQVNRRRHMTSLALGVLRSHWGQGHATHLVAEALAWSRSARLARVELTVHTTNLRAIFVYLRAGFQVEGIRRKSLLVAGKHVDEYQMAVINAV